MISCVRATKVPFLGTTNGPFWRWHAGNDDGNEDDGDEDGDKKDCELIREMLKGNGVAGGDGAQKWRWSGKPASSQVPQPTFMLVGEPD